MDVKVTGTPAPASARLLCYEASVMEPSHHLPDQAVAERGLRRHHACGYAGTVITGQVIDGQDHVNEVSVAENRRRTFP